MQRSAKEFLVCCSYNVFNNLAHAPRGTLAKHGLTTFALNRQNGSFNKLREIDGIENPAFLRYNPQTKNLYGCTESIDEDGLIVSYKVTEDFNLVPRSMQSANGLSTCYLTLDNVGQNLLFVNYWDSSLGSLPMNDGGDLCPMRGYIKPVTMKSRNRADHLINRQLEPHAHALVLDPFNGGKIAYVPDLGLDIIKQYGYNSSDGSFSYLSEVPSALGKGPHGPRYIEFHKEKRVAYVVNELSSLVSVFNYDDAEAEKVLNNQPGDSLKLVQQISTVPEGYTDYNTCGRIAVHSSGKFVLVSNRGHDSIAVYNIQEDGSLTLNNIHSTLGETPRHFQLNKTGEICVVANQDTDSLVSFNFDLETGAMETTGEVVNVASPNFVCFVDV